MTYQHDTNQINQLADALEDPDLDMNGLGWKAAFHLRELQARIAELESMLDAVGAGGVGESIKPQVQPDTTPAAWAIFTKGGFCRMWSQDRKMIERTAAELGVKAEPMYRCTGRAPQPHIKASGQQ